MTIATVLTLAVVGAAGAVLIDRLIRNTSTGIVLVISAWIIDSVLQLGGVQLGPILVVASDVVYGALLVAAVARLLRTSHVPLPQGLLVALALLITFSLVRGVADHGIGAAANEARKHIYLVGGALYFSTVFPRLDVRERVGRLWLGLGAVLAALAIARWAGQIVGFTAGVLEPPEAIRVLNAGDTLLLVQGFLIVLTASASDRRSRTTAGGLFALSVVMQHRTLWVLLLLTLAILVIRGRRITGRLAAAVAVATAVTAVLVMTVFGSAELSLSEELAGSAKSTGTFEWRLEGWRILVLEQQSDVVDIVFGQPFGGGWERRMDGQVVSVSPHNFYVEAYLRSGILGAAVLLGWFGTVLRRLHRSRYSDVWLSDRALFLLVVGYGIYFLTYTPPTEQSLMIGLCTAAAGAAAPRSAAPARTLSPPLQLEAR